ncbi:DUF1120 domain-containing protein [Pantoea anthophila]|uniref:DUF1120 domain-containing protein n=1 Tax=Pantoea anthophila TaxID=470931 RepID=UPI00111E2F3E|nr:DUF1120 domain-containing protein [Pantoea anthophila]MEB6222862.1 DUF1120 domain-containing protein [Pantoea anthophila]TPE14220.1 DUF1120 domain-containing protein [Pantoea vagans]
MRKLLLSTAIIAAMASVSFAGQAAESATLSITGTITPAACGVALSSSSIDLGTIAAATLLKDSNVKQGNTVTLNVDCEAPVAIAVQTTDNRAASAMTLANMSEEMKATVSGLSDAHIFGLGTDSAQGHVGAMALAITDATADGAANTNVLTSSDKAAWSLTHVTATAPATLTKNGYFTLAADANSTTPAAMTKASYSIASRMILKKADAYPSGEEVPIDGNVTFSVVYL